MSQGCFLPYCVQAVISRHKNDSTRFLTGVTVGSGWMLSLERLRDMAVYSLSFFIAEADRGLMPASRNPLTKCSGRMESENSRDRTYGKICFEICVAFVANLCSLTDFRQTDFSGPNTAKSRGCRRCVVCSGKQ